MPGCGGSGLGVLGNVNQRDEPNFLSMIGVVALTVAVVILVFFAIGYVFGRVFL